jgi:uncharacterized coiled-coil protein SlyX
MKQTVETPIAIGELIDKITILEIKVARFTDATKTLNAHAELEMLVERRERAIQATKALNALTVELKEVNEQIWDLEDAIRDCERRADFGPHFINIARSIYRINDRRASVKRRINLTFNSEIIEEKSYSAY